MSTCISAHGEYSEHELGDWCSRCGVFNEAAIVAERDALREGCRIHLMKCHELAAEYDALRARLAAVEALAEGWRYKGEFGWGPWQEGHGPDVEGQVLDEASARLRAALAP